ncbi:MAG: hypothetical protein H0U32_03370 [Thermoleophilaceae bacterium]|nr:hypothetical protein [Thermoleophilaceae bacterium]
MRRSPISDRLRSSRRRTERALIDEYRGHVDAAIARMSPATHATCVELAELPGVVRGYEDIRLRAVERFRERAAEFRSALLDQAEVRPTGQETPVPPSPQ